ncbi:MULTISPECIES: DUF1240 domain-containing protein [Photorhabdus]|uniref:DUF1240 domain-containing protein n=1 Tax=Photorhabdus TaxID=29487 RepID=UPI001E5D7FAB|nr:MULTISPECIES: DUF1240 domain-containing protein [Photorhabdus]MCT8352988.1 DUF1240 domain-containing protein [Photorhabdus kayaii]MDB6369151.1 DUF1240 domain-containing protein [Photorhabdus bodei]
MSNMVVDSKRKIIHIILAVFVLSLVSLGMFASVDSLFSLITMAEVISFSNGIIIAFFFFPLVFYFLICSIYLNLTTRIPRYHDAYVKYLGMIAIVALVLSFPISFYVHYKLKSDGYLVCPRISWMSPNTYVKDIKLCD